MVSRCAAGAISGCLPEFLSRTASVSAWEDVGRREQLPSVRSINRHGGNIGGVSLTGTTQPDLTHAEVMLAFDQAIEDASASADVIRLIRGPDRR